LARVVNAFSVMMALGAGVGLIQVMRGAPEGTTGRWLNAGGILLLAGLVGARLGYVWLHQSYFNAHPAEIFQVWQGGLSWPGALLACAFTALLLMLALNLPLYLVLDRLADMAFPVAAAAWIGCWMVGAAYGATVSAGAWYALNVADETGAFAARFPTQPLAAAALIFSYVLLPRSRPGKRLPPGQAGWSALMVLGFNLLIFSLLVDTPSLRWNDQRIETWAALALAFVAAVMLYAGQRARRPVAALPLETEGEV
jgi:phosphatidylglycerol:prolipoprotein diacylglycerol transferase